MSMDHILPASAEKPDSQFLPGTSVQYAWDSTSLTNILSCPRRYKLSIIGGYVPRNPNFAIALVFGILQHKGLEFYHVAKSKGATHDEAVRDACIRLAAEPATATLPTDEDIDQLKEAHDPDEDDGITLRNSRVRTRYYLFRAVVWYLEHYREDPAETIILTSGKPAVELSFRVPIELDGVDHPIILCGHIDRGMKFNGSIYAGDYKTTKAISRQFFDGFDLSHQMTGYTIASSVIFDEPARGAIIDGIALQVGGVKFGRHVTTRSQGQVREYFDLLKYANQLAVSFYERDFYPMNTASCYFCDFKQLCRQPPEYRDSYLKLNFEQKRGWNPLENR